jgi:multimeric flavodoxin WrbA
VNASGARALIPHGVQSGSFQLYAKAFRRAVIDRAPTRPNPEGNEAARRGRRDAWPPLRKKVLGADIFILGTPIWLGQPSSVCKRVLERMDAFLSETDDEGRMVSYGRVACVAVVGNEDGAHHVTAELYQALADVGFTIPANAVSYWVGRAMQRTDYLDLKQTPEEVVTATAMLVSNTVHLAKLLKKHPYPGYLAKEAELAN